MGYCQENDKSSHGKTTCEEPKTNFVNSLNQSKSAVKERSPFSKSASEVLTGAIMSTDTLSDIKAAQLGHNRHMGELNVNCTASAVLPHLLQLQIKDENNFNLNYNTTTNIQNKTSIKENLKADALTSDHKYNGNTSTENEKDSNNSTQVVKNNENNIVQNDLKNDNLANNCNIYGNLSSDIVTNDMVVNDDAVSIATTDTADTLCSDNEGKRIGSVLGRKRRRNKKKNDGHYEEQDNNVRGSGICREDYNYLKTIGNGAFGCVYLVRKNCGPDSGTPYALKMIRKVKIEEDPLYETNFKSEREALEIVRSGHFLSTLFYSFQTCSNLIIVMDYNSGGKLLDRVTGDVLFTNDVRFYLAELLVAVNYMHEHGLIHRDIKPENVLLDSEGHIVLIDYGLSKIVSDKPNKSHVGTEPYIAPEILLEKAHDRMVDFWSIGMLGYEMIAGTLPYSLDLSDEQLRKSVLEKEVKFSPKLFQKLCKSLLSGLLQKNPKQRLGAITKNNTGGMKAVMEHKFFQFIDWKLVPERKLKPPYIPKLEDITHLKEQELKEVRNNKFRKYFENYNYSWLELPSSPNKS